MISDIGTFSGTQVESDVCVIGGGAAGITLARELAQSDLSVILLEGGGTGYERATHELYDGHVVGIAHNGMSDGRARMFGGTTTRWAGQALPLQSIDFASRDWVKESGWPLSRADLQPYYDRACAVLGVPIFPSSDSDAGGLRLRGAPPFDERLLISFASSFSPHPNLAEAYGSRLASQEGLRVILHANVTEIVTEPSGRCVEHVVARSLGGDQIVVAARTFVVCAGGLETARLLLASDRHAESGIGNRGDLVGRCFQDHPGLVVGPVHSSQPRRLLEAFRPRRSGGIRYQPLFRASERLQREEGLLNVGGAILYGVSAGSNPVAAGKLLLRSVRQLRFDSENRAALRSIAKRPLPLVNAAFGHYVFGRPPIDTSATPHLTVGGEQAPNRESRVYLSSSEDALGMRRLELDWRLTQHETRSWSRFAEVAGAELERTGLGTVDLDAFRLPDDPGALSGRVVDAAHHIGTARMAVAPPDGVVDPNCRVFGVENLYIASSAVFPSGGFSNPTLTIIALTIRLSDHLTGRKGHLREGRD